MNQLRQQRYAYTLMELLISLGASGVLLAGLASTLFIATKAADTKTPSQDTLRAALVIDQLKSELAFSTSILSHSTNMIDFMVSDRDGDGLPERIRYQWTGISGDALTRQYNEGSVLTVANDLADFALALSAKIESNVLKHRIRSANATFSSQTPLIDTSTQTLAAGISVGQYFHADQFSSPLPIGTDSWAIHEIRLRCSLAGSVDGSFLVQIRTATSDAIPTSEVLGEAVVAESDLSATATLHSIVFDKPIRSIHPKQAVFVVCKHLTGVESVTIGMGTGLNNGAVTSTNDETFWQTSSTTELTHQLVGTHNQVADVSFNQTKFPKCDIALQINGGPRLEQPLLLENRPSNAMQFCETQFYTDPTDLDLNRDNTADWTFQFGNIQGVANGIWSSSKGKKLVVGQPNFCVTPTVVEVVCRQTTNGGNGAIIHVDADWSANLYCPLELQVKLESNATQTVTLKSDAAADPILLSVNELQNDFLRCRMLIDPTQDRVELSVNGISLGAVDMPLQAQDKLQPEIYMTNDLGTAEFDYFSIQILNSP